MIKPGLLQEQVLQVAFAKHIPLKNDAMLSLGIEARGLQYKIDYEKLQQTLGNDAVLGSNDNKFKFDAGFGIAYADKKIEIGASVSQLIQSKLGFYEGTTPAGEEGRLYRHFYLHGAYKWKSRCLYSYQTKFPVDLFTQCSYRVSNRCQGGA